MTDFELRLVAALRRAARKRGGPPPSIAVADALLDERREWIDSGYNPLQEFHAPMDEVARPARATQAVD